MAQRQVRAGALDKVDPVWARIRGEAEEIMRRECTRRAQKGCSSATLIGNSMPILLYIAMWSCALGMASTFTPVLARDSQNRE